MPDERPLARRVLLLRDPDVGDPYEDVLRAAGYEPVSRPVLRFTFVGEEALRADLARPKDYGGLILTSPRAVQALVAALGWLPAEAARWHTLPVFAVGPATAAALHEAGFAPEGEASGTAELLADYVAERSFEAPLLFLCGNRRRDTLPERLRAAGVPFEERCVYETHLRDDLDVSDLDTFGWVVFFSPTGVEAARRAGAFGDVPVPCAAIGPTTADALALAGRQPEAVAGAPTPEALVEALRRYDGR